MIRRWEKEFKECTKMKRKRAYYGKERKVVKHAISQEVFHFIKTKDIFHDDDAVMIKKIYHLMVLAPRRI